MARKRPAHTFVALAVVLLAAFFFALATPVLAGPPVREAAQSAAAWLAAHQNPDGSFGDRVPMRDTPTVAEALAGDRSGASGAAADAAASWLATQPCPNNDYLARRISALLAPGVDVSNDASALVSTQNDDGGFGLSSDYSSDPFDTALVLRALALTGAETPVADRAAVHLVSAQNADGGWGWGQGDASTIYVTSHAVLALAASGRPDSSTAGLAQALTRAGVWLESRQATDGSFGVTAYESALAYLALTSSRTPFDSTAAVESILARQQADGGFEEDPYETALCLSVLRQADVNLALAGLRTGDDAVRQGAVVRLEATVMNSGSGSARDARVAFFLGDPAAGGVRLGEATASAVSVNASSDVAFNLDTSAYLGTLRLFALVDPDGALAETDETDNAAEIQVRVAPALAAPALLAPSDGSLTNLRVPTFFFDASDGATAYQLQLDRSADFDSSTRRTYVCVPEPLSVPSFTLPVGEPLTDGTWHWRMRSTDGSLTGSWSAARALLVDASLPTLTVTLTSPDAISPNGDGVQDALELRYSVSEDAQVTVEVRDAADGTMRRIEDAAPHPAGGHAVTWDGRDDTGSLAADGAYVVLLRAQDAAGNVALWTSGPIVVDTVAPTVSGLSASLPTFSPNGDGLFETETFDWAFSEDCTTTVSISGPSGVVRLDRTVDGTYLWEGKNAYGTVVGDSRYTTELRATDAAGNRSEAAACAVDVKTACALGRFGVSPNPVRPGETVTVVLAVADDSVATATVEGRSWPLTDADGNGIHTVEITAPATCGNHPVTVNARDSLGHTRTLTNAAITVATATVPGQTWVEDSYADFADGEVSFTASSSAEEIPGSMTLSAKGWSYKAFTPTARFSAASAAGPGGRVYVFGGFTSQLWDRTTAANEAYDPATNTWEVRAPMPAVRVEARAVTAPDGKVYVIGGSEVIRTDELGWTRYSVNTVDAYDPATDTWQRDTAHGGPLAVMPTDRCLFGISVGPDGKIYCFGGFRGPVTSGGSIDTVDVYDPVSNTWETRGPMPRRQCCFAMTAADGTIYVMEGESKSNASAGRFDIALDAVWAYDTGTDTWRARTRSPVAREEMACARAADGRIYVYGGYLAGNVTTLTYAYDPAADTWRRRNGMLHPVALTNGASDPFGRIYAFGGRDDSQWWQPVRDTVQCFDWTYAYAGSYVSNVRDLTRQAVFGTITWQGETPTGTAVTLRTRTSVDGTVWSDWSETYTASGCQVSSPSGRYVQYRVDLTSSDPLVTPRVDRVDITYNLAPSAPNSWWHRTRSTTPEIGWTAATDPELDPILYEVQLDTAPSFDSAARKSFPGIPAPAGAPYPSFNIPAAERLADGRRHMRVRATDGHAMGPWSPTYWVDVDSTGPKVDASAMVPSLIAPKARTQSTATLSFTVSEQCNVWASAYGLSGAGYTNRVWSWARNYLAPGVTYTLTWDGTYDSGAAAPDGPYEIRLEATDILGNHSDTPARATVAVRAAPTLGQPVWVSSDPGDPQAPTVLAVPIAGNVTRARAVIGGVERTLSDPDGDAVFSGGVLTPSRVGTVPVERIEAADELTANTDSRTGLSLVAPGFIAGSVWTQTALSDFAAGTLTNVATVGAHSLTLRDSAWTTLGTRLSTARGQAACAVVGTTAYLFGGYSPAGYAASSEAIDLASGQRRLTAPMPTRRFGCAAAAVGGRVYVVGGRNDSGWLRTVEVYDPTSDTWTTAPPMPIARAGACAFASADGRLFVAGGTDWFENARSLQVYDPTAGTWSTLSQMPVPVSEAAGCAVNGRFFVFGGTYGGVRSAAAQVYDPATAAWSRVRDLPMAARGQAAARLGDSIYVYGSSAGSVSDSRCWAYDPSADTYSTKSGPAQERINGCGASFEGRAYALGGSTRYGSGYTDTIEVYDPVARGTFVSAVKDTGALSEWTRVGWTALVPPVGGVAVQTRSSTDGATFSEWSEPCETGTRPSSPAGRYIQLKVTLTSSDPPAFPILGDVSVGYVPARPAISAPVPCEPAPTATIFDNTPRLSWLNATGGGARTYEVQLDTTGGMGSPAARTYGSVPELADSSRVFVPSAAPLADTTWYWRVRAADENGPGPWSDVASLTVRSKPDVAISGLTAPTHMEAGDVAIIRAELANLGAPVTDAKVRLFDLDATGTLVRVADRSAGALGYGQTCSIELPYDALGKLGAHELWMVADPDGALEELSEDNNAASAVVHIAPGGVSVTPSVDRTSYVASETVGIGVDIANQGNTDRDTTVLVQVLDTEGALVADVGTIAAQGLAPGETRHADASWTTSATYAGDYKVKASVMRDGRAVATGEAPFAIAPDLALDAKVTVDHIFYLARDTVGIRSRVISRSRNHIFSELRLTTAVTGPEGATVLSEQTTMQALNPDELRDYGFAWQSGTSAPGTYTAVETVSLPDGSVLAESTRQFAVLPTAETGAGLWGALETTPGVLHQGQAVELSWAVGNDGNSDIAELPVTLVIVDPDDTSGTQELSVSVPLSAGAATTRTATVDTAQLPRVTAPEGRRLLAILRARVGERVFTLDSAPLRLLPVSARLSVSTDARAYDCDSQVAIDAAATNLTTDYPLAALETSLSIQGPDGAAVLATSAPLGDVAFGEQRTARFVFDTARHAPGTYRIGTDVIYRTMTLASEETTFEVLSTAVTGAGLIGSIAATPATVSQGDAVDIDHWVRDDGNAAVADLDARVRLVDATSGESTVLAAWALSAAMDQTAVGHLRLATGSLPQVLEPEGREFDVVFELDVPAGTMPLSTTRLRVMPSSPFEVSKQVTAVPRVLVWAETSATADLAARALSRLGGFFKVVTTEHDFMAAVRTGVYNTLVMLDTASPLLGHDDAEVADYVRAGASLIGSGRANGTNFKQTGVFGVKFTGYTPPAVRAITIPETTYTCAVALTAQGKLQILRPETASVLATVASGPIVVTNRFGQGRSVLFAFDLATATPQDRVAALLERAIRSTVPSDVALKPGAVAPVAISVHGAAGPMHLSVTETVSAGSIIEAAGAASATSGTAIWDLTLGAGESRTLTYLLRLPDAPGQVILTTTVAKETPSGWQPAATTTLTLSVTDAGGTSR